MNRLVSTALLCLWLSTAQAGQESLQYLHQLRSLGFSVCANVLVQFNDYEEVSDPRRPEAYHANLDKMQQLAKRLQATAELKLIDAMQLQIAELEAMPRTGTNRYGHGLQALLKLQMQLEQALAARYTEQAVDTPAATRTLHALSLDTGRMLLLYQIRAFILLPKHELDISEDTQSRIDQRIISGFQQLDIAPAMQPRIAPIHRRYQFVRDKLLDFQQKRAPSGVALYLDRNIRDLDQLAEQSQS
ncbi:hypothetical protein AOX61_10265 [Pseudomonas aeruginosa]|uniref:hypothetical protein n=1 Tax=Pseudomonas aeruginosa TaxID=287 RepID=UPI00070833E4|nr:hypothetical protein [Pseudomonas aeruginosa]KQK61061.1 hypothetical protein AOX61_10265 [Pseudomonas aeruginosa]KQK66962.1 hypothetical protein AOX62_01655 [Pseudomonas aeruginosa]